MTKIWSIFDTRWKRILLSIWAACSAITFMFGGGFATRYVLDLSQKEFIRYEEQINSIKSIDMLSKDDGYVVSLCFNALLAYTPESNDYQLDVFFKRDFTGGYARSIPRDKIMLGCKKIAGSTDLLTDALSNVENSSKPYYKLGGIYSCNPGFGLGCFVNPKQKRGQVEIGLEEPEYKYTDNSNYLMLLPIAWIVDVILAPIFVIYYSSWFLMYLLWAVSGGDVPVMP